MDIPETRYAKTTDGVHIAYQVVGEGPDLVLVAWGLGLGDVWRDRRSGAFLRRLASFSRLILLDRRGTGLSDHVLDRDQQLTLESRMEDIRSVMDAADATRAVLLGIESGGFSVAAMFAATLPERTAGLIAYGAAAREQWAPDYPWGEPPELYDAEIDEVERGWGTTELAQSWARDVYPKARDDPEEIREFVSWMQSLGGPGDAVGWFQVDRDSDIRELLPSIRVPTLVIHRSGDRAVPIEHGRYLAEHIAGAELAELPGHTHGWPSDDDFASSVERFLNTIHQEEIELDRVLATVVFTDIVGSTEKAAALGDHAWRELVERHHAVVRGLIARYRGNEMDTAGDGFFMTFEGPARAVRCAQAIRDTIRVHGIDIRVGVHTGEVETIDNKAGGLAVAIGARIGSLAGPSEILASSTVKDLTAGSGLTFEDAGEHELKGVPNSTPGSRGWQLWRVVDK